MIGEEWILEDRNGESISDFIGVCGEISPIGNVTLMIPFVIFAFMPPMLVRLLVLVTSPGTVVFALKDLLKGGWYTFCFLLVAKVSSSVEKKEELL